MLKQHFHYILKRATPKSGCTCCLDKVMLHTLCKNCLYSELFWSAFSRIQTEYGEIFGMNWGKYGPE